MPAISFTEQDSQAGGACVLTWGSTECAGPTEKVMQPEHPPAAQAPPTPPRIQPAAMYPQHQHQHQNAQQPQQRNQQQLQVDIPWRAGTRTTSEEESD